MALDCKINKIGFKEKKVNENTFKKMQDTDLCFFLNPKIKNWNYFEFGKIRELNKLPNKDSAFRILCNRNINAIEILNAFSSIDEISCSFATLNKKTVEELNRHNVNRLFGRIHPVNENEFRNPLYNDVNAQKKHKITGHVKLFLIKSENQFFTINTSANPKGSSQFECYTIYNSKEYYDFCLNSLVDVANKKTENKYKSNDYSTQLTYINKGGKTPIDSIIEINKTEKIEQIDFVVFSTGIKALNRLRNLSESIKINFHISDFILKMNSQKEPYQIMRSLIQKHSGNIDVYNTHCKITLIKTESNYYIIDSTSNLDSNSKYEITELRNSEKEYNFTHNFIKKHFK